MNKKLPLKSVSAAKKEKAQLKPSYYILLMAYVLVSVFTPDFRTFDSNSTKFLAINILNILSLIVFFSDTEYLKRDELQKGFFKNFIGIAYTLFLLFSLLSFFSAINLAESLINIVKIFTVFTSTYVLYVIFSKNKAYLQHLAVALVILLLIDCITVYYGIIGYISGKINLDSIDDIISVYSNKNIFASALFVKLAAAIWLMYFSNNWQKKLGYISVFSAMLATLFLSARAFYIGIALLVVMLAFYALLMYIILKKRKPLFIFLHFFVMLVFSVMIFIFTQHYLYPAKKDIYNTEITSRLSSINSGEMSAKLRLLSWQRSFKLIKEHPFTGIGTGNWKIRVLEFENQTSRDFITMYKNHNDFIEITAETGILGGLAFLSIFLLIMFGFFRACRKSLTNENNLKYLFFSSLGIIAYSVDAFFNFPADRPEIQVLFAIYVASAAAYFDSMYIHESSTSYSLINKLKLFSYRKCMAFFTIIVLSIFSYLLALNVKSSVFQRFAFEDNMNATYKKAAASMLEGFPFIPEITAANEPIVTNIAFYLIHECKYREAIDMLLKNNSSPYEGRREFYLSVAYSQFGKLDSAVIWGQKAHELKPMEYKINRNLSIMLLNAGKKDEAMQITAEFAKGLKTSAEAWKLASNTYLQCGKLEDALALIKTAGKYLPRDTAIVRQLGLINYSLKFYPYDSLYNLAIKTINAKQYTKALELFNDFIHKKPETAEAYEQRAICHFNLRNFKQGLIDINIAVDKGIELLPAILNLRGVLNYNLGKKDAACMDFKTSMDKGNAEGAANYKQVCGKAPAKN